MTSAGTWEFGEGMGLSITSQTSDVMGDQQRQVEFRDGSAANPHFLRFRTEG